MKLGFVNRIKARLGKIAEGARALLGIGKPPEAKKAEAAQRREVLNAAMGISRCRMAPGSGKVKTFTLHGRKVRSALRSRLARI